MTHPFHPLRGREFQIVELRRCWGEDRVYFEDDEKRLMGLPTAWTSLAPPDPAVLAAAGRAPFRLEDLVVLAALIAQMREGRE